MPGNGERSQFALMIKNGAAFDPVGKWGATYLTARMILEEKENARGLTIGFELERLGVELDLQVGWDAIVYSGSAPADRIIEILGLVGEMLVRPSFSEETFERLRQQLRVQLEKQEEAWQLQTQELFLAELFGANPYGHAVKGTVGTLAGLSINDIRIQYRKLFVPNQAKLAFYHSGDREGAFAALSRSWGGWVKRRALPFTFRRAVPPQGKRVLLVESKSQAGLLKWGTLSVEKNSADYHALRVLEHYITLSLPSWASQVTSEKHIAAAFEFDSRIMPGFLQLSIQAPAEQLVPYYERLRDFMQDLHEGRIDEQKLEEAKKLAYLDLMNDLEDTSSRLYVLLEADLHNLGVNFLTHYGIRLQRVTSEHFAHVVQKYVSLDNFLLLVAGPAEQLAPQLTAIGEVKMAP